MLFKTLYCILSFRWHTVLNHFHPQTSFTQIQLDSLNRLRISFDFVRNRSKFGSRRLFFQHLQFTCASKNRRQYFISPQNNQQNHCLIFNISNKETLYLKNLSTEHYLAFSEYVVITRLECFNGEFFFGIGFSISKIAVLFLFCLWQKAAYKVVYQIYGYSINQLTCHT